MTFSITENSPQAKLLVEFLKTLPFVKVEGEKSLDMELDRKPNQKLLKSMLDIEKGRTSKITAKELRQKFG